MDNMDDNWTKLKLVTNTGTGFLSDWHNGQFIVIYFGIFLSTTFLDLVFCIDIAIATAAEKSMAENN